MRIQPEVRGETTIYWVEHVLFWPLLSVVTLALVFGMPWPFVLVGAALAAAPALYDVYREIRIRQYEQPR